MVATLLVVYLIYFQTHQHLDTAFDVLDQVRSIELALLYVLFLFDLSTRAVLKKAYLQNTWSTTNATYLFLRSDLYLHVKFNEALSR